MNEPRKVTFDIEGEPRTVTIIDGPHADEWPAGDPVPSDKETLGWFVQYCRHREATTGCDRNGLGR